MKRIKEDEHFLQSQEYKDNEKHYSEQLNQLKKHKATVCKGGSKHSHEKHAAKGKWPIKKRIDSLLDANSTWDEIGLFAGWHCKNPPLPRAALIAGIGYIHQQPCMVIANDPTVKGGCFFPLTIKKYLRAMAIAEKHHLPCVHLVDSGGAYLPMQADIFADEHHFGRIFYQQANLSAKGIVQIAIVLGSCTAGGAYIPAMADQTIMVANQASVFLAGPPLVKAATGEEVSIEALGGAEMHCKKSGVADYLARNEKEAFEQARSIIQHVPQCKRAQPEKNSKKSQLKSKNIYGHISHDKRFAMDAEAILAHMIDDASYQPFKAHFGQTLLCGFAHIGGYLVGMVANQGILLPEAALKGTHFIQLCNQRNIPLIFLQNITGFMVGKQVEEAGITKHGAKMVMAVANSHVPKFTVFMGSSYGAGNYAMCGSAFNPNRTWIWPNATIAVMGGEQAVEVLNSIDAHHDQEELLHAYQEKASAYYAASELWVDCMIDPADTRECLIQALKLCPDTSGKPSYGVFRM